MCMRYGSGTFGGGTNLVMCDFRTYYTLYCVCVFTSGHNWGEAAQENVAAQVSAAAGMTSQLFVTKNWSGDGLTAECPNLEASKVLQFFLNTIEPNYNT